MAEKGRTHDEETLAQAIDRVGDDAEDPLDRHAKSRGRVGWADLPHAIMNVPVSWAREQPWMAGHVGLYAALAALAIIAVLLVLLLTS